MIDNRIFTFLELCNIMNYHKTADNLNMTQPAVTQHIKYLENLYSCKLFEYKNKKLYKTQKGAELEKYARSIVSLNMSANISLSHNQKPPINIGATKTIGDYVLSNLILKLISDDTYEINLLIDNTKTLFERLNEFELDIIILEGYFDKNAYKSKLISNQKFIGICSPLHPFANQTITIPELIKEKIILREEGSGSRAILEHNLYEKGFSLASFKNKATVSSTKLIEQIVENDLGIAFVYDVIPKSNSNLCTFEIAGLDMWHEFNFVYLNDNRCEDIIDLISSIYTSI